MVKEKDRKCPACKQKFDVKEKKDGYVFTCSNKNCSSVLYIPKELMGR